MQEINKDRWKINKIGLINYWWYDEEEFNFEDGRMILRGTNGSRKKCYNAKLYTTFVRW